jgi:DNA polymerase elongation subunit (family B)
MAKEKVGFDVIEKFLEGRDPQKYIVGIEASYHEQFVSLIINDPERGKFIEKHSYNPFLWMKHDVADIMYSGKRNDIKAAMRKHGVKIKALNIEDSDGNIPERLEDGYKFMATCKTSYTNLIQFFKDGGVDIFDEKYRKLFVAFAPAEQFLIQTGKRLFKGMDDYNDVHRLQFDLETMGLDASVSPIFQIGIRDNRGFELILETKGDTDSEKRESERENIITFFEAITRICPDIITGYNSENFDWPYLKTRCERLGLDITSIAKTLHKKHKLRWKDSMIKLGGETEYYKQTIMWGFNILDISHSVRRAQAINSNIKSWSLKYITDYSGVAKKNRVYVPGDALHTTWADERDYWFNDENGSYGLVDGLDMELPKGATIVKGDYIVQRYLQDDLWETEQVDGIYNQAAYLIAKLLPTSYMRSSTMGTAGQWKLIMASWSYEQGLGIPALEPKRSFTGGLSRLLEVGYARDVIKLDFAALYPKTQLTHGIFPALDISGVMEGLLTYVVDKRDEFKFLTSEHKDKAKELKEQLDENLERLTPERIAKGKQMITDNKKLASDYDKKQLPLKILANSFFGAYGAPYIFNWGDTDCAEETTCRGRQYLRLMVKHFTETHGFRPLVGDTDGFNFAIPESVDNVKYICKANHWKTNHYEAGVELTGLDAVLAEFNEVYMVGRMGLDVDDICSSTINFARKNYANDIDGKVKLVGNSIKSKAMPVYIEEFLAKGIRYLLDGKGYEFIEWYYQYVDDIYNYKIPVAKIASKSKVKMSVNNYKKVYTKQKNKGGNYKARQAHMELIVAADLKVNLGDVIYYVNTGTAKSHSDVKAIKDKETKEVIEIQFNCKMISAEQLEKNPDLTNDEYNVAKYLDAFNKRIKPLLVCFDPEIRDEIIIDVFKDKKTKVLKLKERSVFTQKQCTMMAGKPFKPEDQDTYEALMTMEDKELRFWDDVDKLPNNMEQEEWDEIRLEYKERIRLERINGISSEKRLLTDICMRFEVSELNEIRESGVWPKEILSFCTVVKDDNGEWFFHSKKWEVNLHKAEELFKYEEEAIQRQSYYNAIGDDVEDDRYEMWLEYKMSQEQT